MVKTRLSRRLEKKTKKNFLLTIAGIIILIVILIKFGIPLLANISMFISQIGKKEEDTTSKQKVYVEPPVLNPLPIATNSAKIIISGRASKDQEISLYINDELIDETLVNDDGEFSFKQNLDKGENIIRTKAKIDESISDFSDALIIAYEDKSPELTINSPSDGQSFGKGDKTIIVSGETDPDTSVTVNDYWALTNDQGEYSYNLNLNNGENTITIVATDEAGNKTEKIIKVNFSE